MLATAITEKLRNFSTKTKLIPNPRNSAGKKGLTTTFFSATKKISQKELRARIIKKYRLVSLH